MRPLAYFVALAGVCALFACSEGPSPITVSVIPPTASTSETKSDSLPVEPPAEVAQTEASPDAGAAADAAGSTDPAPPATDADAGWWDDCLPFVPCFPPDER